MTFQDFRRLRLDAAECGTYETYLLEVGGSVPTEEIKLLAPIYNCKTVKDLRKLLDMTQPEFAREYRITLRTLQYWEQDNISERDFDFLFFAVLADFGGPDYAADL